MICGREYADMIEVELISADMESFMNSVSSHAIALYNIEKLDDFRIHFWIKTSDFKLTAKICSGNGDQIKKVKQKGVFVRITKGLHRPILLTGIGIFLILLSYIPSRVLFIQVSGNENVSAQEIISAAESSGIYFGASRKEVRSEKVKNSLLSQLPDLQWAGVNTKGCVALISVKEKTEETKTPPANISSIVASRDGIITSYVHEEGNLLCTIGQAVQKGQLLISGLTDCGLTIRATQASGEITAATTRKATVIIPTEVFQKAYITEQKKNVSLLIGKKRINLWKGSGISDATCDRIYKEYYVMLPGGYALPVGISVDSCVYVELKAYTSDLASVSGIAADYTKNYLQQQMIAGKILNCSESFSELGSAIHMTGEYVCNEIIGIVQQEQIGE